MSRETDLDSYVRQAVQLRKELRAKIFAEEAAGNLAEAFGTKDAVLILRGLAQHLEDFG